MKTTRRIPLLSRFLFLAILPLVAALVFARGDKMKPEELVAKHLASIGTAEARAAARNRTALGVSEVVFLLGAVGRASGKMNFVTAGPMIRMEMDFNSMTYPGDLFAFDGRKVNIGCISPSGGRYPLGDFVYAFDVLLKEGLLGGALSTAWPLLDLAHRQPRLRYAGLKKVERKKLHELTYERKKGNADLLVSLYFDPETFRLVRSKYNVGRRPDPRLLVETFDNFKEVDGLTLPHAYKITYNQNNFLAEWNLAVTKVTHNVPLDPKVFAAQ